ncbi:MAG TPA: 4Fe-4S dicluster domain-containing protein [Anaerolineae bacterium]|nr:4Fe-4S dicluster domain-containing protein [Anaerolineae bacterium]
MAKGRIEINEALCKGCTLCTLNCPKEILHMAQDRFNAKGYRPVEIIDPEGQCTGCSICAIICPEAAITVFRMVKAKDRVAEKV